MSEEPCEENISEPSEEKKTLKILFSKPCDYCDKTVREVIYYDNKQEFLSFIEYCYKGAESVIIFILNDDWFVSTTEFLVFLKNGEKE